MAEEFKRIILLSDIGSMDLAKKVHSYMSKQNLPREMHHFDEDALYVNRFGGSEIDVDIRTNVRGRDVYLFKSCLVLPPGTNTESNYNVTKERLIYDSTYSQFELEMVIDALRRANARSITAIILHQPYQRQDRRATRKYEEDGQIIRKRMRGAISARIVADNIVKRGASSILTMDPHFKQIEALYNIPVDILQGNALFAHEFEGRHGHGNEDVIIFSGDVGGASSAQELAYLGGWPLGVIFKSSREVPGSDATTTGIMMPPGYSLEGKHAILRDDIMDSGSTLMEAGKTLKKLGATTVTAAIPHFVGSGKAVDNLNENEMELVTINSSYHPKFKLINNCTILDASFLVYSSILAMVSGDTLGGHVLDYSWYKANHPENGI